MDLVERLGTLPQTGADGDNAVDKYYPPHQLDQYIKDHSDLLRDYDSHSTISAAHMQQLQDKLRADAEGVEHEVKQRVVKQRFNKFEAALKTTQATSGIEKAVLAYVASNSKTKRSLVSDMKEVLKSVLKVRNVEGRRSQLIQRIFEAAKLSVEARSDTQAANLPRATDLLSKLDTQAQILADAQREEHELAAAQDSDDEEHEQYTPPVRSERPEPARATAVPPQSKHQAVSTTSASDALESGQSIASISIANHGRRTRMASGSLQRIDTAAEQWTADDFEDARGALIARRR
jgi:hypothetical protein